MRTKQFGVLGVILALIFGVRTANRAAAGPGGGTGTESGRSAQENVSGAAKGASSRSAGACGDAKFQKEHWWLSQSSQGCSMSLTPVWNEICKIGLERREKDLLSPNLTGEQFLDACLGGARSIGSMMAAVPNPQRTHLGLMTDRAIEAIQVAASEARFLPLSHYLPWPAPGTKATRASAGSETESAGDFSEPGVLIFRDVEEPPAASQPEAAAAAKARPKYLLVFLIPELPTEGLDVQVFSNAAAMIEKLSPGMDAIRFAGPSFSGSVASLMEPSEDNAKRLGSAKCIHAISGSVTNPKAFTQTQGSCSTFDVVQTGDHEAICRFVRGARAFGYENKEIAILSEEGTQYGQQATGETKAADADTGSQGTGSTEPASAGSCDAETAGLWFLHFPREISKLRNAYGEEAGKATSTDSTTQTNLGLQWQDAESAQHDDLQTYGARQTPLSQETVLSTLSITLRAQGIKALGILATDPMDEAFLIHQIRASSPNVRLFLRDPDLLFLRTPDVASLNGTLLVSNYPLIPQNQFWSSTNDESKDKTHQHRLITFPSAFQEGEYNAFIQLIKDAGWAPTTTKMKLLEWNWPEGMNGSQGTAESNKPGPLWLAAMGTAGHYPIKVLNPRDANRDALQLHSLELGPPQFLPVVFWGLIAMLGILQILGLVFPGAVPSYFKNDFDLSEKLRPETMMKISCHMMVILTIGLTQFLLGSSYLFFYGSPGHYKAMAIVVGCTTAFLAGAAGVQVYRLYSLRKWLERRHPTKAAASDERIQELNPRKVFVGSIVTMAIMVGAGALWGWMTMRARFDNAFLHFRDLNLSSGVAPILPLASVLMVLYFGVWGVLRRLSYWAHHYVEMFDLKLDQVIRRDMKGEVQAIDRCLLGPLENRAWMAAFLITFAVCIVTFRPWITLDMIEPSRVWMFVLFFLGCALLSLWLNWFRLINVWVHLKNILDHLENLPIRTAFQRLPHEKSMPILQWSSAQNIFLLRQMLDRLRCLAHADPSQQNVALKTEFEARIDALMKNGKVSLGVVERRVVGGSPWPSASIPVPARRREDRLRAAQEEMTNMTKILSARLLDEYWIRGSAGAEQSPGTNQGEEKQQNEVAPEDRKYLLAEDIVALPFYAYIRKTMCELRNIVFFLGIALSLLFATLHTYAFRAEQSIDWWFVGLFVFMGGGVVAIIAQMERNALLSRLSNTTPGQLGGNFYLQLLKYGTVPLLTILGSQVPSVSNVVLKWVQPALETLR